MEEGTLHKWFSGSKDKSGKPGWVNVVTGDSCASDKPGEGVPKCVSSSKRASMTPKERKSAAARKRKADPDQQEKSNAAKPTYVSTNKRKKMKEEFVSEEDKKGKGSGKKDDCYYKVKARFKVWPSAYASGALVKCRKSGAKNWGTTNENHIDIAMGKELDDEGSMIKNQLEQIERFVKLLRMSIKDDEMQLPAWVQSKVTLATDYLDAAANYMSGKDESIQYKLNNKIDEFTLPGTGNVIAPLTKPGYTGVQQYTQKKLLGVNIGDPTPVNKTTGGQVIQTPYGNINQYSPQQISRYNAAKSAPSTLKNDPTFGDLVSIPKNNPKPIPKPVATPKPVTAPSGQLSGMDALRARMAGGGASSQYLTPTGQLKQSYDPDGNLINEAVKTIQTVGQLYCIILNFQSKMYNIKLFFPNQQRPSKEDVQDAVNKVYPGAIVYAYYPSIKPVDSGYLMAREEVEGSGGSPYQTYKPAKPKKSDGPYTPPPKDFKKKYLNASFETDLKKRSKNYLINIGVIGEEKSPAWQRAAGKNPEGGLNDEGIRSYREQNPGSKLQKAVTTEPSKLKAGSKSAKRRKSFCARMSGMKSKLTSTKTARDPNSRINKSLRKWNC